MIHVLSALTEQRKKKREGGGRKVSIVTSNGPKGKEILRK